MATTWASSREAESSWSRDRAVSDGHRVAMGDGATGWPPCGSAHAADHAADQAGEGGAALEARGSVGGDGAFGTDQPQLIGEVYCMLLLLLHQVYRATNAHALDFPALLALVDSKLRHALATQPGSLRQLRELLLPPEVRYTPPFS